MTEFHNLFSWKDRLHMHVGHIKLLSSSSSSYSMTRFVFPPSVMSLTREPLGGLSSFLIHLIRREETKSRGVHVLVSALGIHFLLLGVSRVLGRMAAAQEPGGKPPLSSQPRLRVSWCTAALAMP